MIERGHKPIIDALAKMTNISTGKTAFYLSCGCEAVLHVEIEFLTWKILPWDEIHTIPDLLACEIISFTVATKILKIRL